MELLQAVATVKLAYPKIPDTKDCPLKKCIAFEKIDGTAIILYYHPKYGYHSFGTRRDSFVLDKMGINEFIEAHPGLEEVPNIINQYNIRLPFDKDVILFTEFSGEKSFAGQHQNDDHKKLTLFDIAINGRLIDPYKFVEITSTIKHNFSLPKILYKGKYSGQLVEDIRKDKYNIKEGAVIKGVVDNEVYMTKVKTDNYMYKLMNEFKDSWKQYWE
jgi:hypothetical protein